MTMTKTPCGVVEGIISLLVCSGGKKYWGEGAWPLIIWEPTTAKRNYYRTN